MREINIFLAADEYICLAIFIVVFSLKICHPLHPTSVNYKPLYPTTQTPFPTQTVDNKKIEIFDFLIKYYIILNNECSLELSEKKDTYGTLLGRAKPPYDLFNVGGFLFTRLFSWLHYREEDYISAIFLIRKYCYESINSHTKSCHRWHSVFHCS